MRILQDLPWRGAVDGMAMARAVQRDASGRDLRRQLRLWAFPIGGALILTGLLVQANPVLGEALARMFRFKAEAGGLARGLFWIGAALAVWPLIALPHSLPAPPPVAACPACPVRGPGRSCGGWCCSTRSLACRP